MKSTEIDEFDIIRLLNFKSENLQFADGKLAADKSSSFVPQLESKDFFLAF
jgi:hypothetical protein